MAEEGAFAMTTLWAIEALSRTQDQELLAKAVSMLEDYMGGFRMLHERSNSS